MAIFKDLGVGNPIFQDRDNLLDETGLEKYSEQFGADRTVGYMEAVRDFNNQLKKILGAGYAYNGVPKAGKQMRNEIKVLFHENDNLISTFINRPTKTSKPEL